MTCSTFDLDDIISKMNAEPPNTLQHKEIKPANISANASYPRLNSHTCLCPRQIQFVYNQSALSPCQSCLLRLNGRLAIQGSWHKPRLGVRYTSMLMGSPGCPSDLPPDVAIAPRSLINESGVTVTRHQCVDPKPTLSNYLKRRGYYAK